MGAVGRGGGGDAGALTSPGRWLAAPPLPSPRPRTKQGNEEAAPPEGEWAVPGVPAGPRDWAVAVAQVWGAQSPVAWAGA